MLFFLLVLHFSTLLIILLVRPILHLLIIIYKRTSFETNETFFPISILHTMPFRQPSATFYSRSSFSATPLIPQPSDHSYSIYFRKKLKPYFAN